MDVLKSCRWKASCLISSCLMVPLLAIVLLLFAGMMNQGARPHSRTPAGANSEDVAKDPKGSGRKKGTRHPSIVEMNSIWDAVETLKYDLSVWWNGE
ncbi:MAG: hypothetical protein ACKN81_07210 [Pirellulaceae bacterium]